MRRRERLCLFAFAVFAISFWTGVQAQNPAGKGTPTTNPVSGPLTAKMAIYNSLLGEPWACTTQLPAMGDQPAHPETASVSFTTAPRNVLAIEVSSPQFAARNFIGFDTKSNQYWRTEMGIYGGIMRETSDDGVNFSGISSATTTMGSGWEPVHSILSPVQPDGTSSDTEFYTRNGVELKITSVCKR